MSRAHFLWSPDDPDFDSDTCMGWDDDELYPRDAVAELREELAALREEFDAYRKSRGDA